MKTNLALLVLMSSLVMACDPMGSPSLVASAPSSQAVVPPPSEPSGVLEELKGRWGRLDCHFNDQYDADANHSTTFDGSMAKLKVSIFYDDTGAYRCSEVAFRLEIWSTYKTRAAAVSGQHEIDMVLNRVYVTPETDDIADLFNEQALYGSTSWTAGLTKIFTNFSNSSYFDKYAFELIAISNRKLYWGKKSTGDGKTTSSRPTQIDWSYSSDRL